MKNVLLRIATMLDPLDPDVKNDPARLLNAVADYLDRNDEFIREFVAPVIKGVYGEEGEKLVIKAFTALPGDSVQESLRELAEEFDTPELDPDPTQEDESVDPERRVR